MHKFTVILLALIVLSLAACTAQPIPPTAASPAPTVQPTQPLKSGKIRLVTPSNPGIVEIPFWIAIGSLKQQGYDVELTQYARQDLAAAGLAAGEVDISSSNHQTAWAAIAKGAPIRALVGKVRMMYVLAAKSEIKACTDLQGKTIAYAAPSTLLAELFDEYIEQNCPGTEPVITAIPSSTNRSAALLSEVVDAALLEESEARELDRQAPGKFHVLRYFAEEYPLVELNAFYGHEDYIAQHPEIIEDFVQAVVQANRIVQDPQVLRQYIELYMPDDAAALDDVDTYLAHKAWDVNGGLSPESIKFTLSFLTDAGVVPPGLQPEQLLDLSFLNAVLEEIGKQ
jgi:ABC-type nitrate/sulfonate/bicarbonate transport system substrate-binding protein